MSHHRDFKGVWIPKEIYLDKNLTVMEKLLLAEIDSLSKEDVGCVASNSYLAEFLGCHRTRASHWVKSLSDKGYVSVELVYEGEQVIERKITSLLHVRMSSVGGANLQGGSAKTQQGGGAKTQQGGCCGNAKGINTIYTLSSNVTTNTNLKKDIHSTKNAKNTFPDIEILVGYGKEELQKLNLPDSYEYHLRSKIEGWLEAGGVDGHGKKIRNWKLKIKNLIPFLKPTPGAEKTPKKQVQNKVPMSEW
jgi:hypothetical protein